MRARNRRVRCNRRVSDPLSPAPTYTARVRAIRTILADQVPFDGLVQNNRAANPIEPFACLSASWGVSLTASPTLSIAIHRVEDFAREVETLRYAADEDAFEVPCAGADEYALLQVRLSSIWVVAGTCEVHLVHDGTDLEKLIEPAIRVARTVGCGPYVDDYVAPPLPRDRP